MKKQILRTASIIIIGLFLISGKDNNYMFDAKYLEKSVTKISDNLYAGKFEVSNAMYNQFLNELKRLSLNEDLKICQIDSMGWIADKQHYIEPFVALYHKHPEYYNYPVVNISYEAANLFCKFITDSYNTDNTRKFKKVIFRLPTEEEWMIAAKAGHPNNKYANGNFIGADDGEVFYNFDASIYFKNLVNKKKSTAIYFPSDFLMPCQSYKANDFGLYNMSGNAAEMISVKGITKGGSMIDYEEALKIESKGTYEKSACNIGFRYFMEVVKPELGNDYDLNKIQK